MTATGFILLSFASLVMAAIGYFQSKKDEMIGNLCFGASVVLMFSFFIIGVFIQ